MTDEPEPKKSPAGNDDDDAWIEKVVNVAGNLGFNKMRLRWKLIRWQDKRKKAANLREQQKLHIGYAHKTCGECGAIQDKDEAVCTACGAKLGKRAFQVLGRLGILAPVAISMSTLLAIGILVAYARVWVAAGGGFGSPSGYLLVDFGGRWPPLISAEPWRLLTAVFLHAGLLHLAFNILAIASVGPQIEELYGRATMIGMFVITGVLANVGALQVGKLAVGIGASGGLMGLIGIIAGYGQRLGTARGRGLRDAMLKWSAYTIIFGFVVGADNWAHLFGLIGGAAFGFLVRPEVWRRRALIPARLLIGLIGAVGTLGAIAIILTRTAQPIDEARGSSEGMNEVVDGYIAVCTAYYANDVPRAVAAAKQLAEAYEGAPSHEYDEAVVDAMCDGIQQMRVTCSDTTKLPPETRAQYREICSLYERVFSALPVREPKHQMVAPDPSAETAVDAGASPAE